MRQDSKRTYIGTAMCLIISFTLTSYSFTEHSPKVYAEAAPIISATPTLSQIPTPTPSLSSAGDAGMTSTGSEQTTPTGNAAADGTPSPDIIASPLDNPTATPKPTPAVTPKATPASSSTIKKQIEDESLWYTNKIPMPKAHQKLLWDYCKNRKLNYIDMLSLIFLESGFNQKATNGKYKGYFQISPKNTANIAKTLKIQNKPLDGAINLNMGTTLFSWILADKRVKNIKGDKKMEVALSIFQRGTGGYESRGISNSFVNKFKAKKKIVSSYFKKEQSK